MMSCNYSDGGKHSCCSHSHYCIFNKKRWALEKKITELSNQYSELKKLKNSYILGYQCNLDYDVLINQMNIVKESISKLSEFKTKILEKKVSGYGFEILES